ncbi:MAG TPA: polyprenyl synthetase family protein [Kofleriaceae bacterium]
MLTAARATVPLFDYLAEARRLAIDEIKRLVPAGHECGAVLYDLMLDYPLRDAKGLRPALCIATSRALGGGLEATLPSAALLELYHNAFLIHDDVEDGSELRRDRPTLHHEHGVPVAINVGDGMLALALEPLLGNLRTVGLGKALRIMQTIARMARETAEGQAMELAWIRDGRWDVSDDDYYRMVMKKTGWYSFIAPITIGATIAGGSDAHLATLVEMARELAVAFQIRDDVLNLTASYGKESCGDLWEGKRTLIVLHTMRSLPAASRAAAQAILARPRPTPIAPSRRALLARLELEGEISARARALLEGSDAAKTADDVAQLSQWIDEHASIDYASQIATEHALRARTALLRAELRPSAHHDVLQALVDFTIARET